MLSLLRRIRYLIHRRQIEADLSEEIECHRLMSQRELEESGLPKPEASHESCRALGNVTLAREDSRYVWIWPWLESVWQDARYGVRSLLSQPGFTSIAVLALGIAIGLNTSLFTAFNAMALRPWPVPEPSRVVNIYSRALKGVLRGGAVGFSIAEFRYLVENARSFSGIVAMRSTGDLRLVERETRSMYVSGNFFSVLGVEMERGRGFMAEEDRIEQPEAVAVLSYVTWQSRFAGQPDIVGRKILLDDVPFIVVGVASRDFGGTRPERNDVWLPLASIQLLQPNDPMVRDLLRKPDHCCSSLAGRLAPGVTSQQATAELDLLTARFRAGSDAEASGVILAGTAFLQEAGNKGGKILPVFGLMFAAVLLVLVLACANVGNLLLARSAARSREFSVRLSLGAGRGRIIRQLLTESMLLATLASALGIAIAWTLPAYIIELAAGPVSFHLKPDATVLSFTAALAVFSCLSFGLAPALHGTRNSGESAKLSLRSVLLAVQVSVSVVILIVAGLLVRGVQRAGLLNPGFAVKGVCAVAFDLPTKSYDEARKRAFFNQVVDSLGPNSVGRTMIAPLASRKNFTNFRMPGTDANRDLIIQFHEVSAGYFDVLRIPVVKGRNFQAGDDERNAVLINESAARRYWPGQSSLGKTFTSGRHAREIVGVVKDAYTSGLDQIEPTMYQPARDNALELVVRSDNPAALQRLRATVTHLDPRVQLRITPLTELLDRWLSASRIGAVLAGALGLLALSLASIGVFGVFAYVVQQRTREIGIRMALGAQPRQVMRSVLASHFRPLAAGIACGGAGALLGSRLIQRYLYGLSPLDPVAYSGVAFLLTAAAIVAVILPARRALRVDPIKALRYE